jgi:molybdenum cofactor cytidylyltransferase
MPATSGLWTVVLAAGRASRFGRSKLLVRAGSRSLLALALDNAAAVTGTRCIVVLGCQASRLATGIGGRPVSVVVNRRWREGMASSLAAGISALPGSARAMLVMLADQYALDPAELRVLARVWSHRPAWPAAASLGGLAAAPAIIPRPLFGSVAGLRGQQGARELLRRRAGEVTLVEVPSSRPDLNERSGLAALRRHPVSRRRI